MQFFFSFDFSMLIIFSESFVEYSILQLGNCSFATIKVMHPKLCLTKPIIEWKSHRKLWKSPIKFCFNEQNLLDEDNDNRLFCNEIPKSTVKKKKNTQSYLLNINNKLTTCFHINSSSTIHLAIIRKTL